MFEVARSYSDFKSALIRHMIKHVYEVEGDPDDIQYKSDGKFAFPNLFSFTDVIRHAERVVYVRVCSKTIAKAIVYPKTNKVSWRNSAGWTVHGSVGDYEQWLDDLIDDVDDDYGLNSGNVETPYYSELENCAGQPFLVSYEVYSKVNNGDPWLKIFLISLDKAKALVYCNKKPKPNLTSTGYITVDSNTNFIINDSPAITFASADREVHIASGGGYTSGLYNTPEEVEEVEVVDPVINHGSLQGLANDDSPQYYAGGVVQATGTGNIAIGYQTGANVTTAEVNTTNEEEEDDIEF